MKPILEIQNVSKIFRIQHENAKYLSLRDSITSSFKTNTASEEFYALKDVSFNLEQGDTLGIIGKNGAGKSTLLKILSKITPPTSGKIISRGRIASLLEVGTGFHLELSGKENVFMNGSILGMKKVEIKKNFDAIVDFAGVEQFIDTPLKHYSSGMQLRLAFAVAAFLENEILIIDEVLAVGDAEFQKKCLGKMNDVAKSGRTILFVSHNMATLKNLCAKGIILEKGKIKSESDIDKAINNYLSIQSSENKVDLTKATRMGYTNNTFKFTSIELLNRKTIFENEDINFKVSYNATQALEDLIIGFSFTDYQNVNLIECRSPYINNAGNTTYETEITINPKLMAGIYNINIGAKSKSGFLDAVSSALTIEIVSNKESDFTEWNKPNNGYVIANPTWNTK